MSNNNKAQNKITFKIQMQDDKTNQVNYVLSASNSQQQKAISNQVLHLKGLQKMYSKIFRKEKIWEIMENTMNQNTKQKDTQLTAQEQQIRQNPNISYDKSYRDFQSFYTYGTIDQFNRNYSENQTWTFEKHIIDGQTMYKIKLHQKKENYQKLDNYYLQASKEYNKDKRYYNSSFVSISKKDNNTYWKLDNEHDFSNNSYIPYVGNISVGECSDRSLIGSNLQLHAYYMPAEFNDKFDTQNQQLLNQKVMDYKSQNQIYASINKQSSYNQLWAIIPIY